MTSTTTPTAAALGFTALVTAGLFGASFAVDPQSGFEGETTDGPELIVFMNADATTAQTDAVSAALAAADGVDDVTFLDQRAAYEEFTELFSDKPDLIDSVTPDVLPSSFRAEADDMSRSDVEALGSTFDAMAGVREVRYAVPASTRSESAVELAASLGLDEPAWIDRNIDWVLRAAAAALLVPMALLVVALSKSRPSTTVEVH